MIFAIEGPDCAGKSTLFRELQGRIQATFVRLPPLKRVTPEAMQRELDVWEALYDPGTTYICDRHVITTDRVYAAHYGRDQLRPSVLATSLYVVYLRVSEEELVRRHYSRGETIQNVTQYGEILALYEEVVGRFPHVVHQDLSTTLEWINDRK